MTDYRAAGVDLEAADRHVERIAPIVTATWGPQVVGGFGGFAAGIELPSGMRRPVLMLSTDGVGTKLEIARQMSMWDGVGDDLVAMCVDDLAAAGARPIGFVDYMAVGRLDANRDAAIVASIARACREVDCALVGGETAEHPGVMAPEQVDLAGAALGVVERGAVITGESIAPGDVVVGLPSPNLRSNGFSLVREVFPPSSLTEPFPGDRATIAEVLLRPSVLYTPAVLAATATGTVKGAAHITGGGLPGNLIRPLPPGLGVTLDRSSWEVPDVFRVVQGRGGIGERQMTQAFNLGIGFCLIVDPGDAGALTELLTGFGHEARVIGAVVEGVGQIDL